MWVGVGVGVGLGSVVGVGVTAYSPTLTPPFNQVSKGFGFVSFSTAEEADTAMQVS